MMHPSQPIKRATTPTFARWLLWGVVLALWGCPGTTPEPPDPPAPPKIEATAGTQVFFDWRGWSAPGGFFQFPFPSQLRLDERGFPRLDNFPDPAGNVLIGNLLSGLKADHNPFFGAQGFSVVPVAYFRFGGKLSTQDEATPLMPSKDAAILLINVTPDSPHQGNMLPVSASVLTSGNYVPDTLLAASPYPGLVLRPGQRYAFVVMRSLKDAQGALLGVPKALNALKAGQAPEGEGGDALKALYDPLWDTLKARQIDVANVAAATVFQTRAVVEKVAALSSRVLAAVPVEETAIKGLKLDPVGADKGDHPGFCELHGTIALPQYQRGQPPYDKDGQIAYSSWGDKVTAARTLDVPIAISIPKKPMAAEGYPLLLYVHGTSGYSTQVIDRGKRETPGGDKRPGEGPAAIVAPDGIAAAGLAMPLNKDRLPKGLDRAYLNINNLSAYSFTFVQGTIELRLFIRALLALRIDPSALDGCKGASLPSGASHFRFSGKHLTVFGQSMGAAYAAMVGAVEPNVRAILPTGAGGLWSFFIANSDNPLLRPDLLQRVLESEEPLVYHHPILQLVQMSWEAADPAVFAPHVARRPLKDHRPRHILMPIGRADKYHPEIVMDAVATAYGLQQAGDTVWPGTQQRLKVGGFGGMATYPLRDNLNGDGKTPITHAVVQYPEDDITKDGHQVAFQRDDTIAQWRCFVVSLMTTGAPVIFAPQSPTASCAP